MKNSSDFLRDVIAIPCEFGAIEKIFCDHEKNFVRALDSERDLRGDVKKPRSRAMAFRADVRDRAIGVKFRARDSRSISREISLSIRVHSEKFFRAVVFIEK